MVKDRTQTLIISLKKTSIFHRNSPCAATKRSKELTVTVDFIGSFEYEIITRD
jgi:hypothetical protein